MMKLLLFATLLFGHSSYGHERIITIGGTITEIVFALGMGNKVVGVDATSIYPSATERLTKVGYRQNINVEGILSLKPDLVIASDKFISRDVVRQLKKVNLEIKMIKEDFTFANVESKIQEIAKFFNKEEMAKTVVTNLRRDLRQVDQLRKKVKPKKVMFIYARGNNRLYLAGKGTPAHKMIELTGLKNVFSTIEGFKPISTEALVASNPDAIVMLQEGANSLKQGPWNIKGIKQTHAGKHRNLILVDDLAFLGFGPRSGQELISLMRSIETIK